MAKRGTKKAANVTSQNALALAVGVSKSTMSGWLKRADFPVKRTRPWTKEHVEKLKAWQNTDLQSDRSEKSAAPSTDKGRVDVALKYQRTRSAKVKADKDEGLVILREIADTALINLTAMFRAAVEDLRDSIAGELDGDAGINDRVVRKRVNAMLDGLAAEEHIQLDFVDKRAENGQR